MSDPTRPKRGRVWPVVLSVALHVALVPVLARAAHRSLRAAPVDAPPPREATLELPIFAGLEGSGEPAHEVARPEGAAPTAFGGDTLARVDTARAGRGGEAFGPRAVNLAASDEGFVSGTSIPSHRERDQEQRLRTARHRQTRDDRRATTHPMELTFLASGAGTLPERRTPSPHDPSRGVRRADTAAVSGGELGTSGDAAGAEGPRGGATHEGGAHESPGVGLRRAHEGSDHRASANVALARPMVDEAAPTIPATSRGRPHDTVDSDQAVANAVRGIVHASVTGGLPGAGEGGSAGAGSPGLGGSAGAGATARPLGAGDGDVFDWYAADPMLAPYLRRLHAKVDPLLADAFPRSALLELKQGRVILEVVIAKDGRASVKWPPARPSGVPEFDRNCADAFKRAAPFDPLPAYLGDGPLRLRAPIEAKNPIVK